MGEGGLRLVIEFSKEEAEKFQKFIMTDDDAFTERIAYHVLLAVEPYAYSEPDHERIALLDRLGEFGRSGNQLISELDADRLRVVTAVQINTVQGVKVVREWADHFSGDISMLRRHDAQVPGAYRKEWIFFNAISKALLDDLHDRLKAAFAINT